jgi:hypothetical protein
LLESRCAAEPNRDQRKSEKAGRLSAPPIARRNPAQPFATFLRPPLPSGMLGKISPDLRLQHLFDPCSRLVPWADSVVIRSCKHCVLSFPIERVSVCAPEGPICSNPFGAPPDASHPRFFLENGYYLWNYNRDLSSHHRHPDELRRALSFREGFHRSRMCACTRRSCLAPHGADGNNMHVRYSGASAGSVRQTLASL